MNRGTGMISVPGYILTSPTVWGSSDSQGYGTGVRGFGIRQFCVPVARDMHYEYIRGIQSSVSCEIPSRRDFGGNMRRALNTLDFQALFWCQKRHYFRYEITRYYASSSCTFMPHMTHKPVLLQTNPFLSLTTPTTYCTQQPNTGKITRGEYHFS